jgi:hypothetical protein
MHSPPKNTVNFFPYQRSVFICVNYVQVIALIVLKDGFNTGSEQCHALL